MPTSDETHPFRDSSAGVQAKRDKLLGDRRADLAVMSHAIRRIYVNRTARIGGSLALIAGGAVIVAAAVSPDLAGFAASLLPGEAPAPLANLLFGAWIAAVLGTLLGRSVGERKFTTAMSKAVLPSDDAHHDVARLAGETPDEVGQRMAHRLGRLGRALPLIAAGLIVPATSAAGFLALAAGGYPSLDAFEAVLPSNAGLLVGFASLGTFFGSVLYFKPSRAFLSLPILAVLHALAMHDAHWLLMGVGAIVLGFLSWRIHRTQRKEEYVLGQDGAPLPRPLQLRKRLRAALGRATAAACALRQWRPRRVHFMGLGLLAILGLTAALQTAATVANAQVFAMPTSTWVSSPVADTGSVQVVEDELGLVLDYDFPDSQKLIAADALPEVFVPPGFRATIYVTNINSSGSFFLSFFDADQAPRQLAQGESTLTETMDNCSGQPIPLLLGAEPYGQHYSMSSDSELTVRYYIAFELLNQC